MPRSPIRIDPEFEKFCSNLKKNIEKSLSGTIPNADIKLKNTQVQRIIANMNKDNINVKIKKINGKKRGYKLIFNEKTI